MPGCYIMRFSRSLRRSRMPRLGKPLAMAVVLAGGLASIVPFHLAAQESGLVFDNGAGASVRATAESAAHLRMAQGYGLSAAEIGESAAGPYPADQTEAGQLILRINRLENEMRQINGQMEEMQFETRKLQEQLKKFEEDVDFRFHEGGAPPVPLAKPSQKRGEATVSQTEQEAELVTPTTHTGGRSDAFDPEQNPTAPGAPRPLGNSPGRSMAQAGGDPVASVLERNDNPGAPLDLTHGRSPGAISSSSEKATGVSASPLSTPGGTLIAPATNSPREQFDIAMAYLKQRSYEDSEKSFTSFLAANPKSKLASDAIYFLGETYYLRGRQREAAEQYLKISTHYADSPRAPEALLRLGQSLSALGAKEQACATSNEIGRKYPNAPSMVKIGAEREAKRAQCS